MTLHTKPSPIVARQQTVTATVNKQKIGKAYRGARCTSARAHTPDRTNVVKGDMQSDSGARSALPSGRVKNTPQREQIGIEAPTSLPCQHADDAALGPPEAAYDEELAIDTPKRTWPGYLTETFVKGVGSKSRNFTPAAFTWHKQTCEQPCVIRR